MSGYTHCDRATTLLDCGHEPTPTTGIGTGVAHTPDDRKICYDCANARERETFASAERYSAYVSSDGKAITTWTGAVLAKIVESHKIRGGGFWHGKSYSALTARDPSGRLWYGRGSAGMCVSLRRYSVPRG